MNNHTSKERLLVIALGEATFDLILPWVEQGELPAMERFIHEGSAGYLRSMVPMITPQMWGTIVSGKNPGRHGLFDFWQRDKRGRFTEINGSHIKADPLWKKLTRAGLSSGIVNVPFTYPPQKIKGFMISGEDAPGAHRSISWPQELYDELVEEFGRYRLKDIFPGGRNKEDYLTLVEEDVEKQSEVLSYLLARKEWDFFLTFFSASAITQHYFWKDMQDGNNQFSDVIKKAYKALDSAINCLTEAAGENTNVFIISECGAGPLKSGVQINTLLRQEGFLQYLKPRMSKESSPDGKSIRNTVSAFRTGIQGAIPKSWFYFANKNVHWLKSWIQNYLDSSDIDWGRTLAFSRGKEGDIFINLKGRDPNGIVEQNEYEYVRNSIIEKLMALKDPSTGEPAAARVYKREELYKGDQLGFAPDLVIEWKNDAYMPTESDKDKDSVFVERWRRNMKWPTSGSHRRNGILMARGPGISNNKWIEGAGIIDLAPTWLHLLNQDVPDDLEGKVIAGLFNTKSAAHLKIE